MEELDDLVECLCRRAVTSASSSVPMCRPLARVSGSEGCESTGASITGSSIIDSAKFPVKHMPIAPTPRPPQIGWVCAANARSQSMTGLERFAANVRNSRLMQRRSSTPRPRGIE